MRPNSLQVFGYANGNPNAYVDPFGEYGDLVHGAGMYRVSLRIGMTEDQAKTLAIESMKVDHKPETAANVMKPNGDTDYRASAKNQLNGVAYSLHFDKDARAKLDRLIDENPRDLKAIGKQFHPTLDSGVVPMQGPHNIGVRLSFTDSECVQGSLDVEGCTATFWSHGFGVNEDGSFSTPWLHNADEPFRNPKRFRGEMNELIDILTRLSVKLGNAPPSPKQVDAAKAEIERMLQVQTKEDSLDYAGEGRKTLGSPSFQEQLTAYGDADMTYLPEMPTREEKERHEQEEIPDWRLLGP